MGGRSRSRTGQASLLALVAVALVILAVMLSQRAPQRAEQAAREGEREAAESRDEAVRLREALEGVVRESLAQAVDEVAQGGGFAPHAVPSPSVDGVPVYVAGGRLQNLPTDAMVRAMVREAAARRLEANLRAMAARGVEGVEEVSLADGGVALGEGAVEVAEDHVRLAAELHLAVRRGGGRAEVSEAVSATLPLRLLRLVHVARAAAELYADERAASGEEGNLWYRGVERLAAFLMERDPRVPGPSADLTCEPFSLPDSRGRRHPGFCMVAEGEAVVDEQALRRVVGEDAAVAASLFAARARSEALAAQLAARLAAGGRGAEADELRRTLSWSVRPKMGDAEGARAYPRLNLTVNGEQGPLRLRGVRPEERPCAEDLCSGRAAYYKSYRAVYDLQFPVEVELSDATPAGALPSGSLLRPLRLRFAVVPWLVAGAGSPLPRAAEGPPREADLACSGPCEAVVRLEGAERARVEVEPCGAALSFEVAGESRLAGLPCGVRTLAATPSGDGGAAPARLQVALPAQGQVELSLPRYASLSGRVVENTTVLCSDLLRLGCLDAATGAVAPGSCADPSAMRPLGFVPGSPPAAVRLVLAPVDAGLEPLEVSADADGRYLFQRVLPGRYLLLASPTEQEGTPLYKVQATAALVRVEGAAERDLVLEPLFRARLGEGYVPVTGVMECPE